MTHRAVALIGVMLVVSRLGAEGEPAGTPAAASPSPASALSFKDVTAEVGLDFRHTFGDADLSCIVEDTSAGAAWLDYDRDGDPDLVLTSGRSLPGLSGAGTDPSFQRTSTVSLFRNDNGRRFVDVTVTSGITTQVYAMGAVCGDYDSDGWPDLLITAYKGCRLFRNRGDGTFEDTTQRAGISLDAHWCTGASFLDFDNDGNLDLFVGSYLVFDPEYHYFYPADRYPGPLAYRADSDSLLRNLGDGTFADVSRPAGIAIQAGRTMGVAVADFNQDGFPDIFAANDGSANFLYINHQGRFFTEEATRYGVALGHGNEGTSSMGPEWMDFDGDGHLDLFVPDDKGGALYMYQPESQRFVDRALESGIVAAAAQFVGWGCGAYDLDNDGWPDLFQVNGAINHLQPQEDLVFRGLGSGTFEEVSLDCGPYFSRKFQGRGAAFADMDADGRVDVAVVNLNGPALLLRNEGGSGNHWARLDFVSRRVADPVGLSFWVTVGGKRWASLVRGGSSYLSQCERTAHVGLGAEGRLARLEVQWPGGGRETFEAIPADRISRIVEGQGKVLP